MKTLNKTKVKIESGKIWKKQFTRFERALESGKNALIFESGLIWQNAFPAHNILNILILKSGKPGFAHFPDSKTVQLIEIYYNLNLENAESGKNHFPDFNYLKLLNNIDISNLVKAYI